MNTFLNLFSNSAAIATREIAFTTLARVLAVSESQDVREAIERVRNSDDAFSRTDAAADRMFCEMMNAYFCFCDEFDMLSHAMSEQESKDLDRVLTTLDTLFPAAAYEDNCGLWTTYSCDSIRSLVGSIIRFNLEEGELEDDVLQGYVRARVITQQDIDERKHEPVEEVSVQDLCDKVSDWARSQTVH